jgi:class 3 adenylate cyclase
VITCPGCGRENPPEFKLCPMCGTPLAPPPAAGREERKVVSVLFCDLVGFTSRSESMDVEDVRGTLQPYHELLRRTIESYGGTVEKFIGDAVMALFGAPVVHEDDPERAVRAGLAIVEAVAGLRHSNPALDLHVRLGVNTGEALIALDADPLRGEGMASGDVVNTAARLESAAPTDGVLVGEATYRATGRVIRYEPADPVSAKGKSEPVPAWQALEARSRFGVDVDQGSRSAMVGRDRELDALRGAAERAFEGREVQLVTVVGVPGIGKSRLVWELQRWVDERPELIRWRQGRCLPYGEGVTYWALGEVLKAQAGILESDVAAEAAEKLDAMIAGAASDPTEAAWLRGHTGGLVGADASGGSATTRDEAFAAWRRLLEALAGHGPMVIVLEDLHWADDAMLDFTDHLVEWAADVPLLVVCTARPELLERRRDWGGGKPNATTIALRPLSDDDTRTLVSDLLDQVVLPDETRAALLERAEGNPLYAEEYVRMLAEQGATAAGVLPDTVQGIIAARLDALPADEKALLQDAAVLGKVVWQGGLAAVTGADRWALDERLHRLTRKEFLRRAQRSSINNDSEYAFRHALVRDVAYAQIPRAQRAEKHERAAAWIESLAADREDAIEMQAHHLTEAFSYAEAAGRQAPELRIRTRRALRQAGDRAAGLDAYSAAVAHFQACLDLSPADDPERGYLLLEIGRCRMLTGNGPTAEPLQEAIELLTPIDPAAAAYAHTRLAVMAGFAGEGEKSRAHDTRAGELIADAPPSNYRTRVLNSLGMSAMIETRPQDAIHLLDEYLAAAGVDQDAAWVLSARVYRGLARVGAGQPEGLEEARAAVDEMRAADFFELHVHVANMASSALILGDLAQFRALNTEAITQLQGAQRPRISIMYADLSVADYVSGDWASALELAADCRSGLEAGRYAVEAACEWQGVEARIAARRGEPEQGAIGQAEALASARLEFSPQSLVPELSATAWLGMLRGDTTLAAESLAEMLSLTADPNVLLSLLPYLSPELIETAEALGRAQELRGQLEAVVLDTPWRAAMLALLRGDPAAAADIYTGIGARAYAAFAHLRAAEALAGSDPAAAARHLEQTTGFYERVGATLYLDRARELQISRG